MSIKGNSVDAKSFYNEPEWDYDLMVSWEQRLEREAEFLQAQAILATLIGKTITGAEIEETRIVIETSDGNRYFFYGFLGSGPDQKPA